MRQPAVAAHGIRQRRFRQQAELEQHGAQPVRRFTLNARHALGRQQIELTSFDQPLQEGLCGARFDSVNFAGSMPLART